jgi:cell division protein FtsB
MTGNQFEHIAQEVVKQKHLMDQLEAENRALRQQLADLRAGRGIFVEIAGRRFALRDSASLRDHVVRTR